MYVALDIETTGLDPERDRITEVGAVRFDADGNELACFESLVNPGRPIPRFIQSLTGVTDESVRGAPEIATLRQSLLDFVGQCTVIGHNVEFDLGYLRRADIRFPVPTIDTAELSRLLMPTSQARGLVDLSTTLGVGAEVHHRALADARTAGRVFLSLVSRAAELEPAARRQLANLVALHSPALAGAIDGAGQPAEAFAPAQPSARLTVPAPMPALQRSETPGPVPREHLAKAFAAAARVFPGFEERPQQREMAEYIRNALNLGGQYLVEAGTGVGKSLAYLVPAALHALQNGERVVISTNTINLQEQLLQHDIPALRGVLVAAGIIDDPGELRASLLKGRANYLCLRKWTAGYGANMADPDFARLASAMLLWLPRTETGDRSELSLDSTEFNTWQRFSAQDADCLARQNPFVRDGFCFLQRARKAAESAHIIIVNHALLLADVASGGSALPPYRHLVIDEAHNLEDRATQQFGGMVSVRRIYEALDALYRPSGSGERRGGVVALLLAFPQDSGPRLAGETLVKAVEAAIPAVSRSFEPLRSFLPKGEDDRVLVTGATRASPDWEPFEEAAAKLDRVLFDLYQRTMTSARMLGATSGDEPDAIASELESVAGRLEELRLLLAGLVSRGRDDQIVWIARERDGTASLNVAPLDVGPMLAEHLHADRATAIATSATLAAGGDMRYSASRIGMPEADSLQLGSPFDYRSATLLAAVDDLPAPDQRSHSAACGEAIASLAGAAGGRTLALFTSHASLREAASHARPLLEREGISVLVQGDDGNPRQLTDALKLDARSVIFGTASFWEGVDIRGEALSLLVIARLPFAVPTDPIYRARSEQFDSPFGQYALPSAILRFRQGFGRLIRDRNDRGVVAILDRRIFEKSYGRQFVSALPDCSKLKGPVDLVAQRTREWLAR